MWSVRALPIGNQSNLDRPSPALRAACGGGLGVADRGVHFSSGCHVFVFPTADAEDPGARAWNLFIP